MLTVSIYGKETGCLFMTKDFKHLCKDSHLYEYISTACSNNCFTFCSIPGVVLTNSLLLSNHIQFSPSINDWLLLHLRLTKYAE